MPSNSAVAGILYEAQAGLGADRREADRAVCSRAGENHAYGAPLLIASEGTEEEVDGQRRMTPLDDLLGTQHALANQNVVASRRHVRRDSLRPWSRRSCGAPASQWTSRGFPGAGCGRSGSWWLATNAMGEYSPAARRTARGGAGASRQTRRRQRSVLRGRTGHRQQPPCASSRRRGASWRVRRCGPATAGTQRLRRSSLRGCHRGMLSDRSGRHFSLQIRRAPWSPHVSADDLPGSGDIKAFPPTVDCSRAHAGHGHRGVPAGPSRGAIGGRHDAR